MPTATDHQRFRTARDRADDVVAHLLDDIKQAVDALDPDGVTSHQAARLAFRAAELAAAAERRYAITEAGALLGAEET